MSIMSRIIGAVAVAGSSSSSSSSSRGLVYSRPLQSATAILNTHTVDRLPYITVRAVLLCDESGQLGRQGLGDRFMRHAMQFPLAGKPR